MLLGSGVAELNEGLSHPGILILEVVRLEIRNGRGIKLLAMGMIVALFFCFCGCSRPQKKPEMIIKEQTGQKRRPPEELKQIQSGLEEIYSALKPFQFGTPEQIQMVQKGGDKGEEKKEGQKKGEQGREGASSPSEQIDWARLHNRSVLLHEQWNAFEPNAMKSGASPGAVEGFEDQLDLLTNNLAKRDRYGSQLAANRAAAFVPDFLRLYEVKAPPDLLRLRCLVRDVSLKVEAGDWPGSEKVLKEISSVWSRVSAEARSAKEGDTSKITSKIQYAIADLRDAVKARDKITVMVKGNILEKNIDALIDSLQRRT